MNTHTQQLSPALISIIVVAVIALSSGVVYTATHSGGDDSISSANTASAQSSQTSSATTNPVVANRTSTSSSSNYKDGTYVSTETYYTPDGSEDIKVTLSISNGTVASASIQNSGYDRESAMYQERFAANYQSYVVGRPVDSLRLSRVAGASLTTDAFTVAVEAIKNDATS